MRCGKTHLNCGKLLPMKRLRPRLFTLVSLVSLCLCAVSIYFWRQSYTNPTSAVPTTSGMRLSLRHQVPPLNLNNESLEVSVESVPYFTRPLRYEIDWPALEAIKVTKTMSVGSNTGLMSLVELLTNLTASTGAKVRFTTH